METAKTLEEAVAIADRLGYPVRVIGTFIEGWRAEAVDAMTLAWPVKYCLARSAEVGIERMDQEDG